MVTKHKEQLMRKPRAEHVLGALESSKKTCVARADQARQGGMTEVRQKDPEGSDYVGPQ